MKKPSALFLRTVALIKAIPESKIQTYGGIAELISAPGCGRHVSYILSSSSKKHMLPWHRVISSSGLIASHSRQGRQRRLLEKEGVIVNERRIDLEEFLWSPTKKEVQSILKGLPRHVSIYKR